MKYVIIRNILQLLVLEPLNKLSSKVINMHYHTLQRGWNCMTLYVFIIKYHMILFTINSRVERLRNHSAVSNDAVCIIVSANVSVTPLVNTLRPRQNGRHLPDDIFKRIFLKENVWISLKISLKFVSRIRINNIPALVKMMAWRRLGDKPFCEPIVLSLMTYIWVTRSQWVSSHHIDTFTLQLCVSVL